MSFVCRQQLEEMASKFQCPSVHQFAVEVLRSKSTQRLAWLRQYYTSLNHPGLANTVTDNFLQPDVAQASSSSTATSTHTVEAVPRAAATKSHTEARILQKDVAKFRRRKSNHQMYPEPQAKPGSPQSDVSVPRKKQKITKNYVPDPKKKQTNPQKNVLKPPSDIPSPESEEQEEMVCSARRHKRTKRGSVSGSGAFRAGGGLGVDQASSSGMGPREAAAFPIHTDKDTPSCSDSGHDWSTTLSKPTTKGTEQEQKSSSRPNGNFQTFSPPEQAQSSSSSFLTDLLGDTSILYDLLKPKASCAQKRSSPKTPPTSSSVSISKGLATPCPSSIAFKTDSSPTASRSSERSHTPPTHRRASKGGRKDFWDILNEGNEESINRLTDPAEVQRVCINTSFARAPSAEEESRSLWKTNEKFLWKK